MMSAQSIPLLDEALRRMARRYRLPAIDPVLPEISSVGAANALAVVIEHARQAVGRQEAPDASQKPYFTAALARMIREAMREEGGDPAFQAMVLRHGSTVVRQYASLSAHADSDRRTIHNAVNAIAHPAKLQRMPAGSQRDALAQLHGFASSADWAGVLDTALRLRDMPESAGAPALARGLSPLLEDKALERLQRLDVLAADERIRRYQSLWNRQGPRLGSVGAIAQGAASRRRGAAVEAAAAHALDMLARRLNEAAAGQQPIYRVVTSMRVPPSIPATHERAKTEWDVVLLKRGEGTEVPLIWDVCLLVEAKASVDAATTDIARLLRGIRLLGHADESSVYSFATQEGTMQVRGASLRTLPREEPELSRAVLYCSDAPAEASPRLLGAASRMQLLSAPASLEFASALIAGRGAHDKDLEPVWHRLLESARWRTVLHQYRILREVRELMVHTDDLLAAVEGL